jgi:hypothetical protein
LTLQVPWVDETSSGVPSLKFVKEFLSVLYQGTTSVVP